MRFAEKDKFICRLIGLLAGARGLQRPEVFATVNFPSRQTEHLNETPGFPPLLARRRDDSGQPAERDAAHFSLQTGLISELGFSIDTSTGRYDDRLYGISSTDPSCRAASDLHDWCRKSLWGGARMHADNKQHLLDNAFPPACLRNICTPSTGRCVTLHPVACLYCMWWCRFSPYICSYKVLIAQKPFTTKTLLAARASRNSSSTLEHSTEKFGTLKV